MGQFRKRRMVGSRFQKLSWHRGCDVISNLLARFYFSNFWVFFSAPDNNPLSSVEIFPAPSSDTCSIPDLPRPRDYHTISLLSGERLVVCGGRPSSERSCIVWTRGSTTWTHLHTTRSSYHISHTNKELTQQHGKESTRGLGSTISSRLHRAARWHWWCSSTVHCRDCARFWEVVKFSPFLCCRWRNLCIASR